MRRLFAVAAACAVAVGFTGASDTATPTPPPGSVQKLVDQLGADRYADREAAAAALLKLGPAALPALHAATRSENPEVRARVAPLIVRLARASDSVARLVPKKVKLDYKDIPLGTAVNDLKARTGLPLVLDANRVVNPLRKVTCETGELPVWEALEAFCVAANLRELFVNELDVPKPARPLPRGSYVPPPPPPNADSVALVLVDGRPDRLPGDRATAVRVVALPPRFTGHKVSLGTGEMTLCLDVTPTPGLNWLEVVGVKVTRVVDSSGRLGAGGIEKIQSPFIDMTGNVMFAGPGVVLRFDPNTGNPILPETTPNPRVVAVPLKVATPTAKSLNRLEGLVFAEINVLNQPLVTIDGPTKNTGKAFAGADDTKLTVLELKGPAGPNGWGILRVQLESPSPWAAKSRRGGWNPGFMLGFPESPQHPSQARKVEAFDGAGKPIALTQTNAFMDFGGDGMTNIQTLEYRFRHAAGTPMKLAVTGPKTVLVEIPFAMQNVPLP